MSTTRYPQGVTNVEKASTLGLMGQPDPSKFNTFWDDFQKLDSLVNWTVTTVEAGAGS